MPLKTKYFNIDMSALLGNLFNVSFLRFIYYVYHACADPENFLRGGPNSQKGSDGKFRHGKK